MQARSKAEITGGAEEISLVKAPPPPPPVKVQTQIDTNTVHNATVCVDFVKNSRKRLRNVCHSIGEINIVLFLRLVLQQWA